jgi:crossover junction endodeoxyribonuclease RusA
MSYYTYPLPPSANRYWRIWRGRAVLSGEAREYKTLLKTLAHRDRIEQLVGPAAVTVRVYRARRAGDLDNKLKVLFDAMQGIFFESDAQVREIHAYLADDKHRPRVEVQVTSALAVAQKS